MAANRYCAAALQLLSTTIRTYDKRVLIEPSYDTHTFFLATPDGGAVKVNKLGLTRTTVVSIGYTIAITPPGKATRDYVLWIEKPYDGGAVEVNRQAILDGLDWITTDPNAGKVIFTLSVPEVARRHGWV
ncbi:hypothetical protein BD413DRAFT_614633 [Trametes elegans]|nr:hypothetical protein BD413DRAFT_614633 [Trametes elegans]